MNASQFLNYVLALALICVSVCKLDKASQTPELSPHLPECGDCLVTPQQGNAECQIQGQQLLEQLASPYFTEDDRLVLEFLWEHENDAYGPDLDTALLLRYQEVLSRKAGGGHPDPSIFTAEYSYSGEQQFFAQTLSDMHHADLAFAAAKDIASQGKRPWKEAVRQAELMNTVCKYQNAALAGYLGVRDGELHPASHLEGKIGKMQAKPIQVTPNGNPTLQAGAPDWIAAQVYDLTLQYGEHYAYAGIFGWGKCRIQGQEDEACYWIAWSNTDGSRELRVMPQVPEETIAKFEASGPVRFTSDLVTGTVTAVPYCQAFREDDSDEFDLSSCLPLPDWTETWCAWEDGEHGTASCDRVQVLNDLVKGFNALKIGLELQKPEQYLY